MRFFSHTCTLIRVHLHDAIPFGYKSRTMLLTATSNPMPYRFSYMTLKARYGHQLTGLSYKNTKGQPLVVWKPPVVVMLGLLPDSHRSKGLWQPLALCHFGALPSDFLIPMHYGTRLLPEIYNEQVSGEPGNYGAGFLGLRREILASPSGHSARHFVPLPLFSWAPETEVSYQWGCQVQVAR